LQDITPKHGVESVAEITERPLYSINVGEVTSEEHVRTRLQEMFTDATKWNAVLLLDEADVVLEKRSFEDIRRNGTVSSTASESTQTCARNTDFSLLVFLRMLEYYQGILFLTTNRLRHIDEAFHSRIHLAYEYRELTTENKLTIWLNFIDQLPEEEHVARYELQNELQNLKMLSLNGRQIRNVLFTARSLARGESGVGGLRYKHVQKMIGHTRGFQRYFSDGHESRREAFGTTATSGRRWESKNAC
jgi:AAA+ superfamily predicted ATPase